MHKILVILMTVFILAACQLHHPAPELETAPANSQNCSYNWATQPLPELSDQVQTTINAAGLAGVSITAEAYGENCTNPRTNKPVSFSTLETDFHITAKVADLTDKDDLGNLLEKMLVVLDAFPTGTYPGPRPGNINVSFRAGSDEMNIMFTVTAGKSARALGYHGEALFEELQKK